MKRRLNSAQPAAFRVKTQFHVDFILSPYPPIVHKFRHGQTRSEQMRIEQMNKSVIFSKVPEITIFFWIIKVLCTTVGETAADFLNVNLNLGLTGTTIVLGIVLIIVLFFQFRSK